MNSEMISYCDEFGHAEDPSKKYMGIAGLLARADNWRRFESQWDECLTAEKIPKPFHMVDFVHHSERFRDARWADRHERIRVLKLLLSIVEKAEVMPVGAAVDLADFRQLTTEQKRRCRHPYYLAFQAVTTNLGFAVGSRDLSAKVSRARADVEREREGLSVEDWNYASPEAVSMVYAKFKGFTGPAEELWNELKRVNMFGYWMTSYAPGDPLDHPPLQAADIWAYSLGNAGERGNTANVESHYALETFIPLAAKARHGHHCFVRINREMMLRWIGGSEVERK